MLQRAASPVLPGLLAAVLVLCGCQAGTQTDRAPASPSARATGLGGLDSAATLVQREAFCGRLEAGAPQRALGGEVVDTEEYSPGDTAEVVEGTRAVADEWSCTYRSDRGVSARAWLFAPPITARRAGVLVRAARGRGCTPPTPRRDFGRPSVGRVCPSGDQTTVSWRGLFGDAWLACSLTAPRAETGRAELIARAEAWCAEVLSATGS